MKKTLITAALPYANGGIHIGHLAGVYIPADIYARYLRLKGENVLFVCGSDEHGVPVTIRAEKEKITVQEVVDKYHTLIDQSFKDFGISFDVYSRTSKPIHYETSQDFFQKLEKNNLLETNVSKQYFDIPRNKFLTDRNIIGTCPNCSNPNAYGDQCEKCGSTLSPDELINPRSTLSNAVPELKETKHWYLPLQNYENWLKEWILEGHKDDWKNNVLGQCKSWIEQGLRPRAITRDLDWGVPVPSEDADAKGKVLYVWFDAPIGYISATKDYFLQKKPNDNSSHNNLTWESYWKDKENTRLLHFIGKDNIVFHCIIFPVMLKAYEDYILPENVPGNEFLNLEGDKISTSRNWAVWLDEYIKDFPDQQDTLRYVLTANMPEQKDNDFTWKDFQTRNNSELLGTLGNFVNRALVLTEKYFENVVPQKYELSEIDKKMITDIQNAIPKISESLDKFRFREALDAYMEIARISNKYLQDSAPWTLAKNWEENKEKIATILNLSLQIVANLQILGEPFLPDTAKKISQMLQHKTPLNWTQAGNFEVLVENHALGKAFLIFQKIEDKTVETQLEKLAQAKKTNELANFKPDQIKENIGFEDFMKIDLRVATITHAEKAQKSKKLLKLTLDTGVDTRIVMSGIAEYYSPEEIIGKQVCLVANLAPKNINNVESQGMILMAKDADGKLYFVSPTDVVRNGVEVR